MSADSLKRLMLRAEARIKPDKGENEKKKKTLLKPRNGKLVKMFWYLMDDLLFYQKI